MSACRSPRALCVYCYEVLMSLAEAAVVLQLWWAAHDGLLLKGFPTCLRAGVSRGVVRMPAELWFKGMWRVGCLVIGLI